jgi:hypothetical protein
MLFLKKDQNAIWIPKHNYYDGPFKLVLEHNLTDRTTDYPELTNNGMNSGYYIFYGLDFTGLESGEHTYKLFDEQDNELVEQGLLQVMAQPADPISVSYRKTQNKIVYNG